MTHLEQLQSYVLDDLFYKTLERMYDSSLIPEGEAAYTTDPLQNEEDSRSIYDRVSMNNVFTKPSLEDMQTEFEALKAELIAEEQARLAEIARVEDRKSRLLALSDIRLAARNLDIEEANMALLVKRIIEEDDVATLESLETENASILADLAATQYLKDRAEEYQKIDHLLKEALVEKELGDNTKWDEYIALRNAIKTQYPKP